MRFIEKLIFCGKTEKKVYADLHYIRSSPMNDSSFSSRYFLNILMILVDFINEIKETKITCKIQLMLKLMLNFTKDADE